MSVLVKLCNVVLLSDIIFERAGLVWCTHDDDDDGDDDDRLIGSKYED